METKLPTKLLPKALFLVVAAIILTTGFVMFLYDYDNKYTKKIFVPQGESSYIVPESGYRFLVDGWEFYPDKLLNADDFKSSDDSLKHYRIWLGEYPNLGAFHRDGNPYGTSTYRLKLSGSGIKSLYLPEPLCASNVYLDGKRLGGTGELTPESYKPLIRDNVYSFALKQDSELIIQTANESHYYGGLYYPPAVGEPDSISRMVSVHTLFYGALCAGTLSLALFCAALWAVKKNSGEEGVLYFGFLCLSFSVWMACALSRMAGNPYPGIMYAVQDVSSMLCIYFTVRITSVLFLRQARKWIKNIAYTVTLGMVIQAGIFPLLFLPAFPSFIPVYGRIISWFKLMSALFLAASALYGVFVRASYAWLTLLAVAANGTCLAAGVLTINTFEPAVAGWPDEYGAFFMVIAFAAIMVKRSRAVQAQNLHLTGHLREEVTKQTRHLDLLLAERGQLMSELGHDLKSPLTSLSNMAQIIRQNNMFLDQDTKSRLEVIEQQCSRMADRLRTLQEFSIDMGNSPSMEWLSLNDFMSDFYSDHKAVMELSGPDFLCEITPHPCCIMGNKLKLERALENLVFNAGDFTQPEGKIVLSLTCDINYIYIKVKDNGSGITNEDLPKIFDHFYTTREADGGQGLGLSIVRDIVLEHNGVVNAESVLGVGTLFTIRLPFPDSLGS